MPEPLKTDGTMIRLPYSTPDHAMLAGAFIATLVKSGVVFTVEHHHTNESLDVRLSGGF